MFRRDLDDAGFQQVRHQMELPGVHELASQLQALVVLLRLLACCCSIAQLWASAAAGGPVKALPCAAHA